MVDDFGQPRLICFAMALMGVSVFCFGFVEGYESQVTVIIAAIFFRFLQGIASAILNIATYSFASMIWLDEAETVIAMLEAMSGIGLIIGPISGSIIYTYLGFKLSFVILGISMFPLAILAYCYLAGR